MGEVEQLKPDCRRASARLPLLLGGSLDAAERESLVAHVSTCRECRDELESIELAWDLFDTHIPSFELAAHALGWNSAGWNTLGRNEGKLSAETIEAHLAHCESCRLELEAVAEAEAETSAKGSGSPLTARRTWLSRTAWASIAAAALIVMFSLLGRPAGVETEPEPIARADFESGAASLEGAAEVRFVSGPAPEENETPRATGRQVMLFSDGFESGMPASWKQTRRPPSVEDEVEDPTDGEHNGSKRAGAVG